MGIHDRDYYRDDEGGFLSNFSRTGQMTKSLIAITVVVFVVQLATCVRAADGKIVPNSGPVTAALELVGEKVMHGEVWRLITCGFLHDTDNIFHIILNMLIL